MIKTWFAKAIYIMVALALVLGFTMVPAADTSAAFGTYAGYSFSTAGGAGSAATWSTAQKHSGTYSVLLDAPVAGDYARVKIPITSTAFSTFAAPSFYYRDGGATATTADIGATWPMLVKSADTVTQGYLSPFPMLGIDNGVTPVTLIGQSWASATAPLTWTQWLNATASKVTTEALWHDGFVTNPGLGGGIPANYAPLSWWQSNASSPYKTGYNVLSLRVGLGLFAAGCATQKAYVDTVSGSTYDLQPIAIENPCYNTGQTVNFRILNGTATGPLAVYAQSNTIAPNWVTLAANETSPGSKIFAGTVQLVNTSPGPGQLLVANGDTVTIQYTGNWYEGGAPVGPGALTDTAKVDDTAPVVTFTPADGLVRGTVNIDSTITETNTHTDTLTIGGSSKTFADPYAWDTTTGYPDGPYTVVITSTDCAGNVGNATHNYTVDNTAPTVTINQATGQADPTNGATINFTVVFSEATTNFATGDVTLAGTANPTTGTVTGSGTTYNVAVTGMGGSGTVIASIIADKATDAAGNGNLASTSTDNTVTYDVTAPTVTINQAGTQTDPTNNMPVNFTVVFTETVTDFATGDVAFTGSTAPGTLVGTVTGTGTTYNVAVNGMTGSGNVVASIPAAAAHDAAGNNSAASTSTDNTVTFNQVNPFCALTGTPVGPDINTAPIVVTATFNDGVNPVNVTGFDSTTADVTVTNGTAAAATGGPAVYTFNVTPTGQGAVTVTVNAGAAIDGSSRPNLVSNVLTRTFDTVVPTVTITAPNTSTNPFTLTITFSEAIAAGTFVVGDVTLTNATPGALAGGPTIWTLPVTVTNTANPMTAQIAAAQCTDLAGNNNTASNLLTAQYSVNGINLGTGWNLISYPLVKEPPNNAIATVLASISPAVNAVWYYDTSVVPAVWKTWSPGNPTPTLTTFDDGKAYWIDMAAPLTLVVTGTVQPVPPAGPRAYAVAAGWNMVGYKSATDPVTLRTTTVYLGAVETNVQRMYRFDNTTQAYVLVNKGDNWTPGWGLWISTTTAGTIYP